MSARLQEQACPADVPMTVVFHIHGDRAQSFAEPELTIEPDDFYGPIGSGHAHDVRAKLAQLLHYPAIAIAFGKVTEGRPYSLALRLRELGYRGELHAVGSVNRELMHHLIRVGFTHIHLVDRSTLISKEIVFPFSHAYQGLGLDTA